MRIDRISDRSGHPAGTSWRSQLSATGPEASAPATCTARGSRVRGRGDGDASDPGRASTAEGWLVRETCSDSARAIGTCCCIRNAPGNERTRARAGDGSRGSPGADRQPRLNTECRCGHSREHASGRACRTREGEHTVP